METVKLDVQLAKKHKRKRVNRLRIATLVMVSIVLFSSIVVAAWFTGEGTIVKIFTHIQAMQENPPIWLKVPKVTSGYLLVPTAILFLTSWAITKVSPVPKTWSRIAIVVILSFLTWRYILWRSLSTLNLNTPLNGVFSLGLFTLEMLMLISSSIQLFLMLKVTDRRREADKYAVNVINGTFTPSVDILIPTYNEPVFILRRSIIGCQALDYPNKTIYLLDDTNRPEMKKLAVELGCEYITRANNFYAKAGNLNNALSQTHGELIVVFDADFVPTKNFLTRTVGFFQNQKIALVQTPQTFYNTDPIARNLGLEDVLTPEEEVFYRQVQPIRDAAGSVICSGTSFVVRRSALEAAGGFFIDSLSEDYFTGISISAQGHQLIYLNEKLSAGLATENIAAHASQRLRWAQGTLQAFFIQANPLTIRGLRPLQRLAHLEGLLHWFTSISRVGFLFMPLAYSFLGVIPVSATLEELLYYFLPYYLISLTVFSWLNSHSRSALLSDLYSIVICFPLAITVIKVMLNPFSKGFKVTPKGMASDRYSFNWSLAWPLIILFIATAISLWCNLGMCLLTNTGQSVTDTVLTQHKGLSLGWLWSGYNLLILGIALLILLDVPKPDLYEWFNLRRVVKITVGEDNYWGVTTMISEIGAEIALTQKPIFSLGESLPVKLEIMGEKLELVGKIIQIGIKNEHPTVRIAFEQVQLNQYRQLVEMLFCRPGQWRHSKTPGEFQSLLLLFKIFLRPRALFGKNQDVNAIVVSQL
ncbi:cellulose synthase catalytic subunit [[Phormidium ambiguum] IAM M-71]|uniref:Cellulose synthase catalytic subunit n=1 Tax=[Phormidium ambiguum] IAM M-71 TaxID=454136 RepID=A0A1U7IKI7_9CYAN|nr:glycosyltransferase [Phormidium ambiguum]OKH37659.1 cellulose synthase catalytic subunit [Phormidium ambiguum IAM M-71]